MEKRLILASALSLMVFVVYFWLQDRYLTPPRPPAQSAPAPRPPSPAPAPGAPPVAVQRGPQPPPPSEPIGARREAPPQRTVAVESPHYHAVVSSQGGKLQDWTLRYRGSKPLVIVGESAPVGLVIGPSTGPVEPVAFSMPQEGLTLGGKHGAGDLVLEGERDGLRVQETLHFLAASYGIETTIRLENVSSQPRTVTVALPWMAHKRVKTVEEKFHGQLPTEVLWADPSGHIERIEDLAKVGNHTVDGAWIGMGSTWYLAALIPKTPGFKLIASTDTLGANGKGEPDIRAHIAAQATPTIGPRQAWVATVVTYVGPKEFERLAAYGLEGALNFGGFPIPRAYGGLPMEWLGVPILRLLSWVYSYVGNYGVAIILLTVVSKILFYPLTVKSMRSMKAMQALQPQVNALRSKYKSDPQRLQRETLELYQKHKVNPMGGCLPMFAQIPIFYALYLALSVSVELQNAPFLCFGQVFGKDLWICDLANQDPIYVLPLLMGVSMFVQQRMTPVSGDPRQAKMMLVMPFVFTFMFLNLPSGLVLYWTVSNVLQIAQQRFMDRGGRSTGKAGVGAREAKDAARA